MRSRQGADHGIDIVISNYNYAAFVTDAIESACRQTHPNVNVIVVDDGSTDNSRDRLRPYEGRVEIVLKENGGQASALNAGMARCRGDVVMFLDADDLLRPHAAARVADAFAADPGLSKLQFRMAVIDAAGRPTGVTKPTGHLRAPTGDLRRAELAFPFDLPWLPGGGSAFRADALRRILPIPERDYPRCGADWYVVHLTALLGKAALLDAVCAEYRVHGRNGYEPQDTRLDLCHVRNSIAYAEATTQALARLADELGLEHPDPILSVSDLANRLISLKLEPQLHPVPHDRAGRLVADAVRAASRRFDVTWPMKLLFVAWFLAVAASPRPLARRLGELLQFPEGRYTSFNRLLGRLRRKSGNRGLAGEA
jgi:glycosyltransferase involved in cell wall biosynthesis